MLHLTMFIEQLKLLVISEKLYNLSKDINDMLQHRNSKFFVGLVKMHQIHEDWIKVRMKCYSEKEP